MEMANFRRHFTFPTNQTYSLYDLAVVLIDICPKEIKNDIYIKTCPQIFIAASFTIAKTRKQSRCSSIDEWINNYSYIQKMEYYSVLKRNELTSHEKIFRDLKCTLKVTQHFMSIISKQSWKKYM